MKKNSFKRLLFAVSLYLFAGIFLLAQEEGIKKIYIKVIKNDSITVDTSFAIDKDIGKDEIQKMIHELADMDVMLHYGDGFEMEGSGEKNINFFVYNFDGGKLDSLKKIHKDEMVFGYFDDEDSEGMKKKYYVMKRKMSGDKMAHAYAFAFKDSADIDADVDVKKMKIEITVDDDGESCAIIHKHDSGEHMKWVDSGSGKHFVFIGKKEIDGKKIIVLESSGNPIRFTTKDGKDLEFILKDKKTGTDIAIDEVNVITIETTEDGNINIVVSDKKKKVVKKESEQKKK